MTVPKGRSGHPGGRPRMPEVLPGLYRRHPDPAVKSRPSPPARAACPRPRCGAPARPGTAPCGGDCRGRSGCRWQRSANRSASRAGLSALLSLFSIGYDRPKTGQKDVPESVQRIEPARLEEVPGAVSDLVAQRAAASARPGGAHHRHPGRPSPALRPRPTPPPRSSSAAPGSAPATRRRGCGRTA